jgi:phosphoserine phosphatase RsbX
MAPLVQGPSRTPPFVDCAWAGAGLQGGESGDLHVIETVHFGMLFAVIDGLGHGPEAALAARVAASILRAHAAIRVQELLERCHEGLRRTRGAVMSLASLDTRSSTIDWCGVGNVEGVLLHVSPTSVRRSEALTARGGVVGYRLPPLKVSTVSVSRQDILILATDGIRSDFAHAVDSELEAQVIADSILSRCSLGSDDALALVVRYLGVGA